MPPRVPNCYRAVRHLNDSRTFDISVGVLDDTLSAVFHYLLCPVRYTRRYGSSVPGPMEARRRSGKRRMTISCDAPEPSSMNWGALWDIFNGTSEKPKLSWQAPRKTHSILGTSQPPPIAHEQQKTLPSVSVTPSIPLKIQEVSAKPAEILEVPLAEFVWKQSPLYRSAEELRRRVETAEKDEVPQLCGNFYKALRGDISSGCYNEQQIRSVTGHVCKTVRSTSRYHSSDPVQVDALLLGLLHSVWDGAASCEGLELADTSQPLLDQLVTVLHYVQTSTIEAQHLLMTILTTVSMTRISELPVKDLEIIMKSWVTGWIRLVWQQTKIDSEIFSLRDGNSNLHQSADRLVRCLDRLSTKSRLEIIDSITGHVLQMSRNEDVFKHYYRQQKTIRLAWLLVVAKLPSTTRFTLYKTWTGLIDGDNPATAGLKPVIFRQMELCELLIQHWTASGQLRRSEGKAISMFYAYVQAAPADTPPLCCLLRAVWPWRWRRQRHHNDAWLTLEAFVFLRTLDRSQTLAFMVKYLAEHNIKLPRHLVQQETITLIKKDPHRALKVLSTFIERVTEGENNTSLDLVRPQILGMLDNPGFHPERIWAALGLPLSITHKQVRTKSKGPISEERIEAIIEVAEAFANSTTLRPRIAQRNVERCVNFLYMSGVRGARLEDPRISRAIARVAVTKNLTKGKWIGVSKFGWVVDVVRRHEGEESARLFDEAVSRWRVKSLDRLELQNRGGDPWRRGPIE